MKKTLLPVFAALAVATSATLPACGADYTISTLAELKAFMANVHDNDYAGDTVKLTADIDCGGGRFTTGASAESARATFRGTFDGQGHKIYNFFNYGLSAGAGD